MCSWYLVTNSKRYRNFRPETVGQRKGYTAKERELVTVQQQLLFLFSKLIQAIRPESEMVTGPVSLTC